MALTPDEKSSLRSALANIANAVVGEPEISAVNLTDDAIELAADRLRMGQWNEEKAQLHIKTVSSAAASAHASAREIQQDRAQAALFQFVNALAEVINGRLGFKLLPVPE